MLTPRIAEHVQFELGNLIDPLGTFWSKAPYDLVLCRNVLMYFSAEAMNRTLARLEQALRMGGFLFLGHAESLRSRTTSTSLGPSSEGFEMQVMNTHEAFFYRKVPFPADRDRAGHGLRAAPTGEAGLSPAIGDEPPDPTWFEHIGRQGERIATLHAEAMARDVENQGNARMSATRVPNPTGRASRDRLAEAVNALDAGRFDEVEELCAPLIEDPDAQYLLALRREHLDDQEGAIAHYQVAAALDTSFAMPRVHLGIVLARLGDHEAARRAFGEAVMLLPLESDERIVRFGGGFTREGLREHCRRMIRTGEVRLG